MCCVELPRRPFCSGRSRPLPTRSRLKPGPCIQSWEPLGRSAPLQPARAHPIVGSAPNLPTNDPVISSNTFAAAFELPASAAGGASTMPATRGPRLLLLLAWAGLTAAAHESIILKMAEGEFTVQSGEDLGQPVGERLRRLRLPQGADVGAELVRLRSLKSKRGLFLQPHVLPVVLSAWCHPLDSAACPCCLLLSPRPAAPPPLCCSCALTYPLPATRPPSGVEWAHPDMPIRSAAVNVDDSAPIPTRLPDNPRGYKQQWGMQRIGMPAAWAVATGAASKDSAVRLCLVDSGVDVM